MPNEIGIGIIGCGAMARVVARLLLPQDPRLRLRGIHDPDPRSVEAARREFGPDFTAHASYGELLARADIQWVLVSSWNCQHREHTVAAFAAGKHVFCQKPLATTFDDCLAMRDAWRPSGRHFVIGYTLRFSPHYRKIKALLDQGVVGRIVSMEFNETIGFNHGGYIMGDWRRLRANAGTHLLEKCSHDIDLAHWMTGRLPARVASFGGLDFFRPANAGRIAALGKDPRSGLDAYQTWRGLVALNPFTSDKDIVDNQVAIIEYENGVRATFHTNCNAGIPERRMYILGTEGALRADVLTGVIETQRIGFDTPRERHETGASGGHGNGDEVLARELAAAMLHGTPPAVGLDEGLISAITCFALDDALDQGRVVDAAPYWRRAGLKP